ncbi:hypothetical protein F5146DRAFT_1171383 [Armillaria mellea]|nr:hypothetical protein F5146DRAFT_1171383 [Armillaria mellea]
MPMVLGHSNRPSSPTPGMLNHFVNVLKLLLSIKLYPLPVKQYQPNSLATMDFQSFPPGFHGYDLLRGGYFSTNPMLWNNSAGPLSPKPPGTDSNLMADNYRETSIQDTANKESSDPHADKEDTFLAGMGGMPALHLMSDIQSMPIRLPESQLFCHVQSNGLTPTPTCPARNLQYQSHVEEPAGSSPWAGNKENVPAQIASSLRKQNMGLTTDDNPIEVPTNNTSEDAEEESAVEVKPKKKKQKVLARSLQLTSARQRILNGSYPHFQFILITTNPWMDDEDNTADEAALKAWFTQLDYLIANAGYQGHPNPTVEELKVIKQRWAQHRGEIKTAARLFVSNPNASFTFLPPRDASTVEHNRVLVKALKTRSAFTYKDYINRRGLFESPLLSLVIKQVYFNDGPKSEGLSFFGTAREIPFTVIALVFTAVLCAIDEWQSGKHEPKSVAFHTTTYAKPYNDILTSLKGWEAYCRDTRKEPDVPANFRRDLFNQGRLCAGVLDEDLNEDNPAASDDSVFGAADFIEPAATA